MKIVVAFVFAVMVATAGFLGTTAEATTCCGEGVNARCTGATPCSACKNCSSCKHCKKEGGTCGICKKK